MTLFLRPTRRALATMAFSTVFFAGAGFAQDAEPTTDEVAAAPEITIEGNFLGEADAPVTIVEYASFTCPHCASFAEDVMPQLRENYIDTGKVRFEFREVYFDRPGLWASIVARCAAPEQYFGVADLLFKQQRQWASNEDAADIVSGLKSVAAVAGLGGDAVDACLQDGDTAVALVAWYQENAKADDVTGTPNIILNGENIGAVGYEELATQIDDALGE